MADLFHEWGSGLVLSAGGDLLGAAGATRGRQRLLRRLLSNPFDVVWDPSYGAGLPAKIGQTNKAADLDAVVRSQVFLEAAVQQDPPPVVTVTPFFGGASVRVSYVDSETGDPTSLGFDMEP